MYLPLFLSALAVASFAVLLRPPFVLATHYPVVRGIAVFTVVLVYFAGMTRDAGVDIENYRYAYDVDPTFIPDVGFQLLIRATSALGVSFGMFNVLVGVLSCYALKRLAAFFRIDFLLLFLLYFVHLIVVRDFATLRVGLAVSVALLALTSSRVVVKGLLYVVALSFHSSAGAFIVLYEFCRWATKLQGKKQYLFMGAAFVMIVALGLQVAGIVGAFDERINIYTGWARYGNPVESYLGPLRSAVLIAFALAFRSKWAGDPLLRTVFYLEVLSVAVFLGFSGVSIFAHRLSNVVSTLYPVLVVILLTRRGENRDTSSLGLAGRAAMVATVWALMSRPGTLDILNRVNEIGF